MKEGSRAHLRLPLEQEIHDLQRLLDVGDLLQQTLLPLSLVQLHVTVLPGSEKAWNRSAAGWKDELQGRREGRRTRSSPGTFSE